MHEHETGLRVDGVVTFWTAAMHVRRKELLHNLEQIDLGGFAPQPRTSMAALKDALEEMFPNNTHRVERLRDRNAYEIIEIERGEQKNDYRHHLWVGIKAVGDQRLVEVKPFDAATAQRVADAFNKHLGLVRANDVSNAMLRILASLSGIAIKPGGHVYWIPAASLERWRQVAAAVEGATGLPKGSTVEMVQHRLDPDSVRTVRNGIVAEITSETNRINDEIMSGDLGKRALEARQVECATLRQKIRVYEGILDTGLESLRERLLQAEESAAAAELILASGAAELQPA